jgi:hypothetical protein
MMVASACHSLSSSNEVQSVGYPDSITSFFEDGRTRSRHSRGHPTQYPQRCDSLECPFDGQNPAGQSRQRATHLEKHHLQPHRVEKFKFSTDPHFVAKVRDIVGLYLNPPEHALVLSVDEKSQIQAAGRPFGAVMGT